MKRGVFHLDGERVHALRNRLFLTQAELADRCGLSPFTIGRVERGNLGVFVGTARRLAEALGVKPQELLQQEQA